MRDPTTPDRTRLDRRAFLELAAASSVVVAAGAVAAGCQGGPPAHSGTQTPPAPPTTDSGGVPTDSERAVAGPVRIAIVTDDVAPAFTFRPLGRMP